MKCNKSNICNIINIINKTKIITIVNILNITKKILITIISTICHITVFTKIIIYVGHSNVAQYVDHMTFTDHMNFQDNSLPPLRILLLRD